LITKKELLNEEEENPKWQEHILFLSLAAVRSSEWQRLLKRGRGDIYRPSKRG
jgi:hypothetical protein